MKRFAILGYPLGHTMSPPIHERLFVLGKQQAEYEVLQTPPEQFEALWPYLRQLDGFNITIPYKQQIIPFCARLDDTAKRYGAVNVVDGKNGGTGYNTDCVGFLRSLEGIPLQGEVLIGRRRRRGADVCHRIGPAWRPRNAGGAPQRNGKSMRTEKRDGRNHSRRSSTGNCLDELPREDTYYRWLINATPAGMYPKMDDMPLDPAVLPRCENVFEAIYNPARTKLMRLAQQAGCM